MQNMKIINMGTYKCFIKNHLVTLTIHIESQNENPEQQTN